MSHEALLRLSIVPSATLFLLSLIEIILTAHYWILGDWFFGRWVSLPKIRNGKPWMDEVVIEYTNSETDAVVVSGTLCLTTAILALVVRTKLLHPDLDTVYLKPMRRFWTGSVVFSCIVGIAAALAAFALHFTGRGNGEYGCKSGIVRNKFTEFTNMWCTREAAACGFLSEHKTTFKKQYQMYPGIACGEATTVKWMQLVLIANSLVLIAMFLIQARIRRKSRAL